MIWAAIGGGGQTEIYRTNRNKESAKGGYSSHSYLEIIHDYLPVVWQPGVKFMHKIALIHTADIVKNQFDGNGLPVGYPHTHPI